MVCASPPCARTSAARRSSAAPDVITPSSRRRAAIGVVSMPASNSISTPKAYVTAIKSSGPRPCNPAIDSATSRALPHATPSGRSMAVSNATVGHPRDWPSSIIVRASVSAWSGSGRNAPEPILTSSTSPESPSGKLLRHDARRDQRDRLDRRGHVAQCIQLAVGRRDLRRLAHHRHAQRAHLLLRFVERQSGPEPRDRFELVERAAGVAQAATRHHRHQHAAGGEHRRKEQRRLVADAAGGMLVDARTRLAGKIEPVARGEHGVGEGGQFLRRKAAEEHRHREGGHLVIGNLAGGVGRDQVAPFLRGELAAVALAFDQTRNNHSRPLLLTVIRGAAIPYVPRSDASIRNG